MIEKEANGRRRAPTIGFKTQPFLLNQNLSFTPARTERPNW
ncbi:hypothetical protein GETHLI_02040 [Geothrix limicola]|uniref:Uncharacterized protein n=1 Tax=Geothrix limicola TaxID=2927978 RepID=A0ABQ5QAQ8_9BACT|nr:hypothetical protein GETHLI_02040 [Geothrix limicola]